MIKHTIITNSYNLYSETELPNQLVPVDTYKIILFRYIIASKLIKNKSALEIGSGPGIGFNLLNASANKLICSEYSSDNIKIIKKNKNAASVLVRADAHRLPFNDNSFDIIIALAMIYYLKIDIFLDEVKRVLRENGELFFCISNKDVPGFVQPPYTTKYYSIHELDKILKNHGFNAQYMGAFPAGKSLNYLKFRAVIKNAVKKIIKIFPYSNNLWSRIRKITRGQYVCLPDSFNENNTLSEQLIMLNPNKVNRLYRIIYIRCSKIN